MLYHTSVQNYCPNGPLSHLKIKSILISHANLYNNTLKQYEYCNKLHAYS